MSLLLELIRTSSREDRAAALAELAGGELAAGGPTPVAILVGEKTVGYLTPTVNAATTLPLPKWTEEDLVEIRRRAAHPEEAISIEEFIRRFEAATATDKPR